MDATQHGASCGDHGSDKLLLHAAVVIIPTRATTAGTLTKEAPLDEWLCDYTRLLLGSPRLHSAKKQKNKTAFLRINRPEICPLSVCSYAEMD